MRYRTGFFMYLAAFFLQPFLQNLIPVFGGNVNLLLCLTVVLTFLYDETLAGIFFGFIFGIFYDLFYGMYTGPGVIALMAAGILILVLREFANIENFLIALVTVLFATWLFATVYWGIYLLLGSPYSYIYAMKTLPLQLLFNSLVSMALYFVLIKRVIRYRRDRYFK